MTEIMRHLLESVRPSTGSGLTPAALVETRGLGQVSDAGALEGLSAQAVAKNPKSAADCRAGKKAAAGFLVRQVMKLIKGKLICGGSANGWRRNWTGKFPARGTGTNGWVRRTPNAEHRTPNFEVMDEEL